MESTDLSKVLELFQIQKVIISVLAFVGIGIFARITKDLIGRLQNWLPSYRLLLLQISTVLSFLIYILGTVFIVYGILNPTKELILAMGGSIAVAVGFSLKDLVASIVAGVTLLFDRPFQVGDRVSFGDTYGEIVSIGLRAVRLNTLDDNLVTIPNAKFVSESVASGNAGQLDMMVVSDFHLGLTADIDKAKELLHEVVATSRFAYLKKPISITLEEVSLAQKIVIRMRVKAYVLDVRYEKAFQSDIISRGNKALQGSDIVRP